MIRIASIDNVSARAFQLLQPQFRSDISAMTPTDSYYALATGCCDAGLVPVGCLPDLRERFQSLGPFGIACTGQVSSVRLFSRIPLSRCLELETSIFVSEKSQTSRRLLITLCQMRYGTTPILTPDPSEASAQLLIGEDALCPGPELASWPHVVDMGAWWFEATELPFVFAVWIVRKSMAPPAKERLRQWLEANVALAESHHGRTMLAHAARMFFASHDLASDYYMRIRPRLDRMDYAGLQLFQQMSEESLRCDLTV